MVVSEAPDLLAVIFAELDTLRDLRGASETSQLWHSAATTDVWIAACRSALPQLTAIQALPSCRLSFLELAQQRAVANKAGQQRVEQAPLPPNARQLYLLGVELTRGSTPILSSLSELGTSQTELGSMDWASAFDPAGTFATELKREAAEWHAEDTDDSDDELDADEAYEAQVAGMFGGVGTSPRETFYGGDENQCDTNARVYLLRKHDGKVLVLSPSVVIYSDDYSEADILGTGDVWSAGYLEVHLSRTLVDETMMPKQADINVVHAALKALCEAAFVRAEANGVGSEPLVRQVTKTVNHIVSGRQFYGSECKVTYFEFLGNTVAEVRTQIESTDSDVDLSGSAMHAALSVRRVFHRYGDDRFAPQLSQGQVLPLSRYNLKQSAPIRAYRYEAAVGMEEQRESWGGHHNGQQMVEVPELLRMVASPSFESRWA